MRAFDPWLPYCSIWHCCFFSECVIAALVDERFKLLTSNQNRFSGLANTPYVVTHALEQPLTMFHRAILLIMPNPRTFRTPLFFRCGSGDFAAKCPKLLQLERLIAFILPSASLFRLSLTVAALYCYFCIPCADLRFFKDISSSERKRMFIANSAFVSFCELSPLIIYEFIDGSSILARRTIDNIA